MTAVLSGKAALVTGGSRGIGAAIVRRLSSDGASVAFTYVSAEEKAKALAAEIESEGRIAFPLKADSADPAAVRQAVDRTVERLGGLDILVNNAGILIRGKVDDYPLEDFERMFAVNVRAVFVAVQEACRHMTEGGRIMTIGSVTADRSAFPGSSVYSMTKAAVAAMTRGFAHDVGPRGITVNTIQPGPTETDMSSGGRGQDTVRSLVALGRMGQDTEIASLAAYLAGPEAGFITGATLTADGGYLA